MITTVGHTRRAAVYNLLATALLRAGAQEPQDQDRRLPNPRSPNEDIKLPNGKSQKDAMAKENHEQALKDADSLLLTAQQLRDELEKAGEYVIPVGSVKKTEEIEKLARRIRGKLKA